MEIVPGGAAAASAEEIVKPSLFPMLSGVAQWIASSTSRCWAVLIVSILLEIQATTMTKVATDNSDGRKLASAMAMYLVSLLGFAAALPRIEVGVAYAVWSALGTAMVSVAGVLLFGERCDATKVVSIILIIIGVVGLNLTDEH